MTVRVRSGGPADHDAAVDVWAASDTARRGSPPPAGRDDTLRARFTDPQVWLLVAEDDGELVGVTQGMPARADDGAGPPVPGLCHLSLVFVAPDRWGTGIGAALVGAALDRAAALGYRRIQLWTHEDNTRAQRLYAGRGFTREGRTKDDDDGERIGIWSRDVTGGRGA